MSAVVAGFEDVLAEAHTGLRRVVAGGEFGEMLHGLVDGDVPRLAPPVQGGDVVGQGRPLLVEFAEQAPEVGAFGSFRGADEVDELTFDVLGAFAGVDGEVAQPDLAEAGREVVEGIGGLSEEEHALARVRKRRRDGDGDLGGAGPRRGIDDDGAARDRCIDDGLLVAVDVDDEELLLRLPVGAAG